jgi:hypothetical protein
MLGQTTLNHALVANASDGNAPSRRISGGSSDKRGYIHGMSGFDMLMLWSSKSELQAELEFLRQQVDATSSSHHVPVLPTNVTENSFQPQVSNTPQSQNSGLTVSEATSQAIRGVHTSRSVNLSPGPHPPPNADLFSSGPIVIHSNPTKGQAIQDLNVDPRDIDECFSL